MIEILRNRDAVKILLAGPFPEPTGGVSVHLTRLSAILSEEYCILKVDESPVFKENIYNLRSMNIVSYLKMILSADIVHVHSSVSLFRFVHCFCCYILRKPLVVTIHSYRKQRLFNRALDFISFRCAKEIIAVSSEIAQILALDCNIIPAFIKPTDSDFLLNQALQNILDKIKDSGKKLAVSNAYKLDRHNGSDLYGFDQIIEAFSDEKVREDWCVVMVVSSAGGSEGLFEKYMEYIKSHNLENIFLLSGAINFCGLLKNADLFVRATLSDGDALSVRESLLLGVRTIASDCCIRPSGTILYKTANVESLKSCIQQPVTDSVSDTNSFENEIIALYRGLL